jgi:type IV pilus assembly protein PilX
MHRHCKNRYRQQGVALFVSLIILLVLTVIGVGALSGTSLEERMAGNYQQSMVAFQAAETAIEKVIVSSDVGGAGANDNPFYVETSDPTILAINAGIDATTTVSTITDTSSLSNATLVTATTVIYIGTDACPGASFGSLICYQFNLQANASVNQTSANTTHLQGIERPAPSGI